MKGESDTPFILIILTIAVLLMAWAGPSYPATLDVPDRDVNLLYQASCHETHGENSEKCKEVDKLVGQEIIVADDKRKGEMIANYFFFRGYLRSRLQKECDI